MSIIEVLTCFRLDLVVGISLVQLPGNVDLLHPHLLLLLLVHHDQAVVLRLAQDPHILIASFL